MAAVQPNSDRITPYRAQYMGLCGLFVTAMKEHQKAKDAARKMEVEVMARHEGLRSSEDEAGMAGGGGRPLPRHQQQQQLQVTTLEEIAAGQGGSSGATARSSLAAEQTYDEAAARTRDVTMLVASIAEVQELFQDLASLVEHQSELVGNIGQNVERASVQIEKGNDAVRN